MSNKEEFEVLSDASNAVVAQHPARSYPGILIQGDTLRALLDDVDELVEETEHGDRTDATEISRIVQGRIRDLLKHYERVLDREGRQLPYANRVSQDSGC